MKILLNENNFLLLKYINKIIELNQDEIDVAIGIIINPIKDTIELESKIELLINDLDLCRHYGNLAREKCINKYNWDEMGKRLYPIFENYL